MLIREKETQADIIMAVSRVFDQHAVQILRHVAIFLVWTHATFREIQYLYDGWSLSNYHYRLQYAYAYLDSFHEKLQDGTVAVETVFSQDLIKKIHVFLDH